MRYSESLSERVINGAFAVGQVALDTLRFLVRHRRPLILAAALVRAVMWIHHPTPSLQEQATQQRNAQRQVQQVERRLQPLANDLAGRMIRSLPPPIPAAGPGRSPTDTGR